MLAIMLATTSCRSLRSPLRNQHPTTIAWLSACDGRSIACTSFRCLNPALSSIRTFRLAPYPAHTSPIPFPCLPTTKMVSASSSRAPRASQNPTPPRFTHVTGKNGASIPIGKASKQELITGLEQYSRRHGEYPDNYPEGPQDLSDSDDEDSDDELDDRLNSETPTHTTKRPSTHTMPEVPDSQPPSKRPRYVGLSSLTDVSKVQSLATGCIALGCA